MSTEATTVAKNKLLAAHAVLNKKAGALTRLKHTMDEVTKHMLEVTERAKEGEVPEADIFPYRFVDNVQNAASLDVEDWLDALHKHTRAHTEYLRAEQAAKMASSASGEDTGVESAKKKAKKDSA